MKGQGIWGTLLFDDDTVSKEKNCTFAAIKYKRYGYINS